MKDSLARIQTSPALTPGQIEALGARAWEESQTLVVRLSQVKDPKVRGMIEAVAEYEFGGGS